MGGRKKASVWSCRGAGGRLHHGAGGKVRGSNGVSWLEALKTKAGRNCYNCLSAGHRIADCRDPPRCILCSRFGHKARYCPHPPSAAAAAAARAAAPAPRPTARTATTTPAAAAHASAAACNDTCQPAATFHTSSTAAPTPRPEMDHRWIPGALGERPGHVHAGVARSDAIREAERDLEAFAIVAVQVNARARLETTQVRQEAVRQLRIPFYELGVSRLSAATFLLRFDNQQQRDIAQRCRELQVGHTKLHLMQWKRQVSSKALSKFNYQARLCIEGVPAHARHAATVAGLFKAPAFIDDLECDMEKPIEEECLRIWLWTSEPDEIPTTGTLHIEEPVTLPQEGYADSLYELGMPMGAMRLTAAEALDYDVIIHVDRVLDYSSPPVSPTYRSMEEETEPEWPVRHPFNWQLGVPDGGARRRTERRRTPVHDRLGDQGRDRSPPRGGAGGAGNLGLRQVPPSGPHDLGGHTRSDYHHGSSSHRSGAQFRRREMQWQVKVKGGVSGSTKINTSSAVEEQKDKEDVFGSLDSLGLRRRQDVSLPQDQRMEGPMVEDAAWLPVGRDSLPNAPQRSVEPTAAIRVQAVSECHIGERAVPQQPTTQSDSNLPGKDKCKMQENTEHASQETEHASQAQGNRQHAYPVSSEAKTQQGGTHIFVKEKQGQTEQGEESWQSAQDQLCGDEGKIVQIATSADDTAGTKVGLNALRSNGPSLLDGLPDVDSLLNGLPFDLNLKLDIPVHCNDDREQIQDQAPAQEQTKASAQRVILGTAEDRLNKDAKGVSNNKAPPKSVSRFAIPLKKALMCNPAARIRAPGVKKTSHSECDLPDKEKKKGGRAAIKRSTLSIDEQATTLLMRASGVIGESDLPTEAAHQQFNEQFVDPLLQEPVCDIRIALGLPGNGHADVLGVLVSEAGVDDD
ncbi:unnamed protein product [Urochloa decumbens]|uniref:CCHC-type domain-containing protein n=1 Tax=Urochloa decumbens TaxID=240449 RepID=A0ABC8X1H3_9POAL